MSTDSTNVISTPSGNVHAPVLASRLARQAARINAGVASGALSSGQAQQLEGDEAQVTTQIAADKVSGAVNGQERKALNQQLTGISQQIYALKHPSATTGAASNPTATATATTGATSNPTATASTGAASSPTATATTGATSNPTATAGAASNPTALTGAGSVSSGTAGISQSLFNQYSSLAQLGGILENLLTDIQSLMANGTPPTPTNYAGENAVPYGQGVAAPTAYPPYGMSPRYNYSTTAHAPTSEAVTLRNPWWYLSNGQL